MKLYRISFLALAAAFTMSSCNDIDNIEYEGGTLLNSQKVAAIEAIPDLSNATFSGMFTMMGTPDGVFQYRSYGKSARPDDGGFFTLHYSGDLEGSDMGIADNDYNWFTPACDFSSRNADYANPYARYVLPYRQIGVANEVIASFPEGSTDSIAVVQTAQARAMRAYDYLSLAPYFAFINNLDDPCVPILTAGVDYTNNPRATVREVLQYIKDDLDYAVEHLAGYKRTSKAYIDQNVAYGLRARANLYMKNYAEAAADAAKAMEGYTPASIQEVSSPAFCNINDHNWMWGIDLTADQANIGPSSTSAAWMSSFSGESYSAGQQLYATINKILYDKISSTDVRKGWWVDEDLYSPLLENVTWNGVSGMAVAYLTISQVKTEFLPYTNVKFGKLSGIGSVVNDNDWPLMRVEEMYLIQAEGLLKSGNEAQAKTVLENFVKTYRDPGYNVEKHGKLTLEDEIWFQRRVELWGEGFATPDIKRLNKPVVRFHLDSSKKSTSNLPENFQFNMRADDAWLNMRFPQTELDNNQGIIDNSGSNQPVPGQESELTDGVTD